MTDNTGNSGNHADDMSEYLQTFLDETEEQLDDLVETMLALERDASSEEDLNEAFRLIHSIKGSAGMMGFDSIAVLSHHLESRFERFRSKVARLDEPTMNLVLRCIDFLRQCNNRLRDGQQLGSAADLLEELRQLDDQATDVRTDTTESSRPEEQPSAPVAPTALPEQAETDESTVRMIVRFRAGLQLADLKAQLIVARLSGLGDVKSTNPDVDGPAEPQQFGVFEIHINTFRDVEVLRSAADVDGVESIEFNDSPSELLPASAGQRDPGPQDDQPEPYHPIEQDADTTQVTAEPNAAVGERSEAVPPSSAAPSATDDTGSRIGASPQPAAEKPLTKVSETMRVDVERLDTLMNLAGELVVNRARFMQISGQVSPELRKANMANRVRDFSATLRRAIETMEQGAVDGDDWSVQIQQLKSGVKLMDEQSEVWENGRHWFGQISEAIDQLSRVSSGFQHGVLGTRMVPVGPLFNRFRRVIRDLSKARGKKVNLRIRGEGTELDKRMIDELGDPLVHLVRNSIDHGLEPPDVRAELGKPGEGTIFLEASHSGNNVCIHIRDDGDGIDVEKIKAKLVDNSVLSQSAADELTDAQALDYIWDPGFSTAKEVTDVSGRGVGMDAVKTRIEQLSGTIEVESVPQRGTTFTIRLPLTLAIINCLLIRVRDVMLSIPIHDVREIVSINKHDIVTVHGKRVFDVRGEMIPLSSIDDVFQWHCIDYGVRRGDDRLPDASRDLGEVVILNAGGKTLALEVDELLGSQDIVIKSLSDNFVDIRGLAGASVMGDGQICLMLDVDAVIAMATTPRYTESEELGT